MATNKRSTLGRRSQRKAPPQTGMPGALRRSSRVKQATAADAPNVSFAHLLSAADQWKAFTGDGTAKTNPQKRVSFEAQQLEGEQPTNQHNENHQASTADSHRVQHSRKRAPPDVDAFDGSQIEYVTSQRVPPSPIYPPQQPRKSNLPPSRAAHVKRLIGSEIMEAATQDHTTKRVLDDIRYEVNGDGLNPNKRRRLRRTDQNDATFDHDHTILEDPEVLILSDLRYHPNYLSLKQVSSMLQIIQSRVFGSQNEQKTPGFAEKYFNFTLSPAQVAAWPLHELRTRYIPLFMTTQYVADGSQNGWRSFFTSPDSRQHLVSAVLGEWFTQRIFKHTAFGFPEYFVDILENKDREYLKYDAIVRSKERAKLMKGWYADVQISDHIINSTEAAAENLAEELLAVLHPLLPPPLFDPLETTRSALNMSGGRKDSITLRKEKQKHEFYAHIKADLVSLVLDCAALHKSIRLTGEAGTIIRMAPHPQKGIKFPLSGTFDCVNPQECNDTVPKDPSEPSELCIKMICWPRFEAVAARGPDMARLEFLEKQYRQELDVHARAAAITKTRANSHANVNSKVANEADHSDGSSSPSSDAVSDIDADPFTWDGRDEDFPIVPDSLQDNEGRNPGILNPETNEINTVKRAAYVTIYPVLCPAKVYCEWTPQPARRPQHLDDAVALARRTHATQALHLRLEDIKIDVWNGWALYGGLAQWGFLTTAAVVTLCRYFSIPSHVQTLLVKLVEGANAVVRGLGTDSINEIPAQLYEQVSGVMKEIWDATGPFGPAIAGPVTTLVVEPVAALLGSIKGLASSGSMWRDSVESGVEGGADGVKKLVDDIV